MHRSLFAVFLFLYFDISAQKIEINGPAGSDQFGEYISVLPNGNFVVIDPFYDDGAKTNVGAVHLYNGANYSLISTLKGNSNNDFVGYDGIRILPNGNFIVISSYFNDGANTFCGAITWCDASNGVSGIVSSSNSLVGNTTSCQLGNSSNDSIKILPNGNYLVCSRNTANGAALSAGSVTWASQATGISGVISAANSLIGSSSNDMIGFGGANVKILTNGNYVVGSKNWDNGSNIDVGAATFCNGNTGLTGIISSANSLIGSQASDGVGELIGVLSNGNYIVGSRQWDNGGIVNAGAATWCDGATGRIGTVSISNSLVGSSANDRVGAIFPLSNGNYLATSQDWDNGSSVDVGAVTFANGTIGVTGTINSGNSLIGNASNTNFEFITIERLTNGNYVVKIPFGFGSATWGSATAGVTGIVSSTNSLVGNATTTKLNQQIVPLPNGNYVVFNGGFKNGTVVNAGAVTWCNGTTGTSGVVSNANSLAGSTTNENVGAGGLKVLPNSNYFVGTPGFDNGSIVDAGAVTWCSGNNATTGTISAANSLIGSTAGDNIGNGLLNSSNFYLPSGKFILQSQSWDNGAIANAGALTMLETSLPTIGPISSANSLVGNVANKYFLFHYIDANKAFIVSPLWNNGSVLNAGAIKLIDISAGLTGIFSASTADALLGKSSFDFNNYSIKPLTNGNYVLSFPYYSNDANIYAGAVTFVNPTMGISGEISSTNSCVGTSANEFMGAAALPNGNYIVVSPNADNGSIVDAGGVMFCNGTTGFSGTMNIGNSLMGTKANDNAGSGVTVLPNQRIYINSYNWDNGTNINAGAITYVKPNETITGIITQCNSMIGATNDPPAGVIYNGVYNYAIASMLTANKIILYIDNQQTLAGSLDESSVNVSASGTYDFIANTGCRLVASITPNGASSVSGNVNAKAWLEIGVPTYASQLFVSRHFEITPDNNTETATARVTLYFTQQEFTDFNNHSNSILDLPANPSDDAGKANLRIGKYSGISNDGSGLPVSYTGTKIVINPNDNDIVWNSSLNRWEVSFDVMGFSGFIVQTNQFILPLQLLSFTALKCNSNNVCLNWKTANEQNVSHFEIQRSLDGRNFNTIKSESAKNQPLNLYSSTDDVSNITASKIYYRIKQIDADSKSALSNIQAVSLNRTTEVTLYPNPATDFVSILGWQYVKSIQVFDASGKLVLQPSANLSGLDISGLSKGIYSVRILKKDGEAIHMKLIKQ